MKNCVFFRCLELGSKKRSEKKKNKKMLLQNIVVYITNNIPVR